MSETPKHKSGSGAAGKDATVVMLERRTLLLRHVQGDPDAFSELVNMFRAPVYSYIVRCGVPESSQDDLFQEIFIKVHCNAHTYQPERPLEPWLFTVVANTVRTFYRKTRIREMISEAASTVERSAPQNIPDDFEAKEMAEWLEKTIAKLPFAQREALLLCGVNDLSQKDVARILDMPVNTVKTHLSRARTALAAALARRNTAARREVSS